MISLMYFTTDLEHVKKLLWANISAPAGQGIKFSGLRTTSLSFGRGSLGFEYRRRREGLGVWKKREKALRYATVSKQSFTAFHST